MMIAFMGDCLLLLISKFKKQKNQNKNKDDDEIRSFFKKEGMNTNEEKKV